MNDADCVAFLQWALPRMQLAWPGFRNVRRTVCRRVDRRYRALGLADVIACRAHLEATPAEWEELRSLCSIPISRLYRDRAIFESLEHVVLLELAAAAVRRGDSILECWSAGCASGEELYTLSILWQLRLSARYPRLQLRVLATDIDRVLLERAVAGCYRASALRECRNVVFTYFAPELQHELAQRLMDRLHPGGALVVGLHESFPPGISGAVPWPGTRAIFCREVPTASP
jgi:chemotaxis protein methyltransferase CheR